MSYFVSQWESGQRGSKDTVRLTVAGRGLERGVEDVQFVQVEKKQAVQ